MSESEQHGGRAWFTVIGIVTLVGCAMVLLLVWANAPARAAGGRDLMPMLTWALIGVPLGLGVLARSRVASLGLAVPCSAAAVFIAIKASQSPVPIMGMNLVIGAVFFLPLWATVKHWRALTWRGSWSARAR